ncbi:MAG: sulfite exporter TauE/SafE family protein [Saprospiraceae bacterium]|nr:sulfite exporter TauE/SafE family protein [Saprospiraceae bacterium]
MIEWLNNLAQNSETPVIAAFALGLLTAVSPCPLATNVTATAYIAKTIEKQEKSHLEWFLYTLGRLTSYTGIGALIYFRFSKFQIAKLFQGNGEKFLGPIMILIGLVMLDVIKLDFLTKGNLTERLSERFKDRGLLGSYFWGFFFFFFFFPFVFFFFFWFF